MMKHAKTVQQIVELVNTVEMEFVILVKIVYPVQVIVESVPQFVVMDHALKAKIVITVQWIVEAVLVIVVMEYATLMKIAHHVQETAVSALQTVHMMECFVGLEIVAIKCIFAAEEILWSWIHQRTAYVIMV